MKRSPISLVSPPPDLPVGRRPPDSGVHLREVKAQPSVQDLDKEALSCLRHDLRSLLNSVVGFSELLGSGTYGPLTPQQSRFVDHLRNSAGKLNERFDAFVELSRQDETLGPQVDVPLHAGLHHALSGYAIELSVDPALQKHKVSVDLSSFRRALERTVELLTTRGAVHIRAHAELVEGKVRLTMKSPGGSTEPRWFEQIDEITDKVDSQSMIEIRLAQRLFERQGIRLALDYELRAAQLTLP